MLILLFTRACILPQNDEDSQSTAGASLFSALPSLGGRRISGNDLMVADIPLQKTAKTAKALMPRVTPSR
jgi:hypothetical protein